MVLELDDIILELQIHGSRERLEYSLHSRRLLLSYLFFNVCAKLNNVKVNLGQGCPKLWMLTRIKETVVFV